MLPIAELEDGATALLGSNVSRHRRTRDRVVSAEVRAVRRRRGWTVVGSETSCGAADKRRARRRRRQRQLQSIGKRGQTRTAARRRPPPALSLCSPQPVSLTGKHIPYPIHKARTHLSPVYSNNLVK
ncbi:unnamed protein product [Danaus chrysippus]|uniref:(African queen) hypothetical protein n=1 Tax=Danaus chrysippus TaxID=151541 RepID=A0A8J2VYT6_9NEOP|nr:unnamed protein product [Danaus chrysippus]